MANDVENVPPSSREVTIQQETRSLMDLIERGSRDPNVNVEKLSGLMDLYERMTAKAAEAAFNASYSRLQEELPRIKKDGTVEYAVDKNRPDGPKKKAFDFATWENVDEVIRPLMKKHGFSLTFNTSPRPGDGGGAIITGTLLHIDGHSRSASIPLPLENSGGKNNVQGMGSTFSYGKRYTTFMLLNIVTEGEDDDGVRGGMVFISDEDAALVNKLIEETETNKPAFLEYIGHVTVSNIPKESAPMVLNMLREKKKVMEKKKAGQS